VDGRLKPFDYVPARDGEARVGQRLGERDGHGRVDELVAAAQREPLSLAA
jgi:hypothetical protein